MNKGWLILYTSLFLINLFLLLNAFAEDFQELIEIYRIMNYVFLWAVIYFICKSVEESYEEPPHDDL